MPRLIGLNSKEKKSKHVYILVFIGHAQSVCFNLQHFGDVSHLVAKLESVKNLLGRKDFFIAGGQGSIVERPELLPDSGFPGITVVERA